MSSNFFCSAKYHNDGLVFDTFISTSANLPVLSGSSDVAGATILQENFGTLKAGLYVAVSGRWRFAMPFADLAAAQAAGDRIDIYVRVSEPQNFEGSKVYKNGQLMATTNLVAGTSAVYLVRSVKVVESGGSGSGGIATAESSGSGVSIIRSVNSSTLTLRSIVQGSNISVVQDGNGGILISSTVGAPSVATSSSPGVVRVGAGLLVDTDGTVSLPNGGVISITGDISGSSVNGFINASLSNAGVNPGSYTKVTVDAKGRVRGGSNPSTLADMGIVDGVSVAGGAINGTVTMTGGATITGVPAPATGTDIVNKNYVDSVFGSAINGISWRQAVKAATTGNLSTLSGLQVIDGYQTVEGDRVLVKNQTDGTLNGIRIASTGTWNRAADADTANELLNMATMVLNGTDNKFTQWVNNNTSINLGVSAVTFAQLQGAAVPYTATGGLRLDGTTFSIQDSGVVAGTYTRVTVNAKGQVTSGSNLNANDLKTILGYTPYDGTANPLGFLTAATTSSITLTGDITGSGSSSIATSLANTGVTAGSYTKVTVDAKGRVTSGGTLSNTDVLNALGYTPLSNATVGAPNGLAQLDNTGKVPASQLPSFVDDVVEIPNKIALPITGEAGKIYIVLADETASNSTTQYRWGGSSYVQITASPGSTDNVPEGPTNKYYTNARGLSTVLTGLSVAGNGKVVATDTVLASIGKLQGQLNNQPYDFTAFAAGKPTSNAVVFYTQLGRAVALPSNLNGSKIKARVSATASAAFTLYKIVGGVTSSITTITFAAGSSVPTIAGSSAQALDAGDELLLVAPSAPDSTLADIGFTILGSLNN